ncbi:hypothetical protein M8C21_024336 [Ambrosia artemisiifolia]|uniref:Uncharacterized protein n=1 Tax=Ambrosia artemisiifolia TaxID=4212 RepID=A0AAD5GXQ2_AMBAR|nr:hypothetical protein M8C21_024336 [Ambrosia artemisiifolia]
MRMLYFVTTKIKFEDGRIMESSLANSPPDDDSIVEAERANIADIIMGHLTCSKHCSFDRLVDHTYYEAPFRVVKVTRGARQ